MHAIALDIGGTKLYGVLVDRSYKILEKKLIRYKKSPSDPTVPIPRREILTMINSTISELGQGRSIKGIGVSIPDVISADGSIVGTSKISSLSDYPLGKHLKKKYSFRVTVNNDADCFALAEQKLGAGRDCRHVVGVIWGTGIGAGIVIGSRIYSGSQGSAGEFGHNIVDPGGPRERTGLRGSVEAFAGGPNIVRNYLKLGGRNRSANPKDVLCSNEPAARKARRLALHNLSVGLAGLYNVLGPDIIVVGGGLSNMPFYQELNRLTKRYTVDAIRSKVKIVKNRLGDTAGVYGAAARVFEK